MGVGWGGVGEGRRESHVILEDLASMKLKHQVSKVQILTPGNEELDSFKPKGIVPQSVMMLMVQCKHHIGSQLYDMERKSEHCFINQL